MKKHKGNPDSWQQLTLFIFLSITRGVINYSSAFIPSGKKHMKYHLALLAIVTTLLFANMSSVAGSKGIKNSHIYKKPAAVLKKQRKAYGLSESKALLRGVINTALEDGIVVTHGTIRMLAVAISEAEAEKNKPGAGKSVDLEWPEDSHYQVTMHDTTDKVVEEATRLGINPKYFTTANWPGAKLISEFEWDQLACFYDLVTGFPIGTDDVLSFRTWLEEKLKYRRKRLGCYKTCEEAYIDLCLQHMSLTHRDKILLMEPSIFCNFEVNPLAQIQLVLQQSPSLCWGDLCKKHPKLLNSVQEHLLWLSSTYNTADVVKCIKKYLHKKNPNLSEYCLISLASTGSES